MFTENELGELKEIILWAIVEGYITSEPSAEMKSLIKKLNISSKLHTDNWQIKF
jgi:hypothetical protein